MQEIPSRQYQREGLQHTHLLLIEFKVCAVSYRPSLFLLGFCTTAIIQAEKTRFCNLKYRPRKRGWWDNYLKSISSIGSNTGGIFQSKQTFKFRRLHSEIQPCISPSVLSEITCLQSKGCIDYSVHLLYMQCLHSLGKEYLHGICS